MGERCPCCSGLAFADCCAPLLRGERPAATALELMRSRYTAYATGDMAYLGKTVDARRGVKFLPEATATWNADVEWQGLRILDVKGGRGGDSVGTVSFEAAYTKAGQPSVLRERSRFRRKGGCWYYVDGREKDNAASNQMHSPGTPRNAPCPCGSGKKFKRCCGA